MSLIKALNLCIKNVQSVYLIQSENHRAEQGTESTCITVSVCVTREACA